MLLSDNKLWLSRGGLLFVAVISMGRHWTAVTDAYNPGYFGK